MFRGLMIRTRRNLPTTYVMNLKDSVGQNKPVKLVGGPFDGKETFLPYNFNKELRVTVLSGPDAAIVPDVAPVKPAMHVAIYLETEDRYRWRFARIES